jgi:hypothetical protein
VGPSDFTRSGFFVHYRSPSSVVSLTPVSGPQIGGTVLTLTGSGFSAGGMPGCHFDFGDNKSAFTSGVFISNATLSCASPPFPLNVMWPAAAVNVGLRVSVSAVLEGVMSSSSVIFYIFCRPRVILGVAVSRIFCWRHSLDYIRRPLSSCGVTSLRFWTKNGTLSGPQVTAAWLSSHSVACASPALNASGPHFLSVSTNGVDFSRGIDFFVDAPLDITRIAPSEGPVGGGTLVTISGHHFAPSNRLACYFGSAGWSLNDAEYINSTTIRCISPATSEAVATTVAVTLNGADFSTAGAFYYSAPPNVSGLTPYSGPSTGGTTVQISGTSFLRKNVTVVLCRFGNTVVSAVSSNDTGVSCVSPSAALIAPSIFLDSAKLANRSPFGETRFSVALDIALNGADFETVGDFFYYSSPVIATVNPVSGNFGTTVRVLGWGLALGANTMCVFRFSSTAAGAFKAEAIDKGEFSGLGRTANSSTSTDVAYMSASQLRQSAGFFHVTVPALIIQASIIECAVPVQPAETMPTVLIGVSGNGIQYDF